MSKTDKTRPWRVKRVEHPVEHHDHRDGVCDLAAGRTEWAPGACYLDAQWWRGEMRCTCSMCSGAAHGDGPRERARRARREGRREARDAVGRDGGDGPA